jgi:hypothetical protein
MSGEATKSVAGLQGISAYIRMRKTGGIHHTGLQPDMMTNQGKRALYQEENPNNNLIASRVSEAIVSMKAGNEP